MENHIFKLRILTWIVLISMVAISANTGSDKSRAHLFKFNNKLFCMAGDSGHSFTLEASRNNQRTMVLSTNSSDLKERTMNCKLINSTYLCDWDGFYKFSIETSIRWKEQHLKFDPKNVQVTGVWQRGVITPSERIFCHL